MLPTGEYLLRESDADEVGNWFKSEIAPNGLYLPPQTKDYGGRYANLWKQANQKSFNYHLQVPDTLKARLLRMLVARLLQ